MLALFAMLAVAAGHPGCDKRFTVSMAHRAIDATYAGTHEVTAVQRRRLDYYTRCQRNPAARRYVRWLRHHLWQQRQVRLLDPVADAVASWYQVSPGESTGCGTAVFNGVANKSLPCGTRVRFWFGGRSMETIVDDRGPYVAGRSFDFGSGVAAFFNYFNGAGVASVGYRIGG